jgi:hypothetical protein
MANVAKVAPGTRMDEMGSPVFNSIKIADGGLVYESAASGLVATPGGTQAAALLLINEMSRVTTVATTGDSVMLPASAPGLTIILENASTNAMQVFGVSPDTINGVATGIGVNQMAGSVVIYTCYAAGAWFANGLGTGYSGSLETQSTSPAVVAHAGGGQGAATQLVSMMSNLTTVATAGDSVVLPASAAGLQIAVANNGAASANVFPPVGSTMNGVLNQAVALPTATVGIYFCLTATAWISK